jgi:hypothetical protein
LNPEEIYVTIPLLHQVVDLSNTLEEMPTVFAKIYQNMIKKYEEYP